MCAKARQRLRCEGDFGLNRWAADPTVWVFWWECVFRCVCVHVCFGIVMFTATVGELLIWVLFISQPSVAHTASHIHTHNFTPCRVIITWLELLACWQGTNPWFASFMVNKICIYILFAFLFACTYVCVGFCPVLRARKSGSHIGSPDHPAGKAKHWRC